MKDFSNIIFNLHNLNSNNIEYNTRKHKSVYKAEKTKNESKLIENIENSPKTNINPIKNININFNIPKNVYCKKRANSYYDKDKKNYLTNEQDKKLINQKKNSINERNNNVNINNNIIINGRITKKSSISRNKHNFLNNSTLSNSKSKKKIMINDRNFSNDNMNKKCINDIEYPYKNEGSIKNILFNSVYNYNNNESRKKKHNYCSLSLSQDMDKKKINVLKKMNKDLSSIDYTNKKIKDTDKEYDCNNNNKSFFFIHGLKNSFDSNILNNNLEYSNKLKDDDKNLVINNSRNKYPIKLINDNTSINLAGSYNFHQYFNTIISNKNADICNSNHKNKSPARVHKIINLKNDKDKDKLRYCNTQLNSNSNNRVNNIFFNDKLIREINDIEADMNKHLKQNTTNSKSKKYNTLKHSFEKLLKFLNTFFYNTEFNIICNFLQKLLIGYHEVVSAYSQENLKLKELNFKLTEQYETIDKNLIECNRSIKEKQKKIEILENKINGYVNNMKNKNVIREYHINMNEFDLIKNKDEQNNKIKKINEQNLDDLDALYFFDKIETKPQRSFSSGKFIPILPINKKKK